MNCSELGLAHSYPQPNGKSLSGTLAKNGCETPRLFRRRFHCRQLRPMRDQPVAIERDPFACVGTRFVGKPFEFGAAVIKRWSRFPAQRRIPIFHGHMNTLVLGQRKGFQRAQYTMLVNRLEMYRHGTS